MSMPPVIDSGTNPLVSEVAAIRKALADAATPERLAKMARALMDKATEGNLAAIRLVLSYLAGPPARSFATLLAASKDQKPGAAPQQPAAMAPATAVSIPAPAPTPAPVANGGNGPPTVIPPPDRKQTAQTAAIDPRNKHLPTLADLFAEKYLLPR